MSIVILTTGQAMPIPYKKAKLLQAIQQGMIHATPAQKAKAAKIKKFYIGHYYDAVESREVISARKPYRDD